MPRKIFIALLGCLILSGCQSLNSIQPKQAIAIREPPATIEKARNDEDIWVPDKISKIWINSYVDDESNMVEGHYKYVITEPGHWVIQESGYVKEDNFLENSKSELLPPELAEIKPNKTDMPSIKTPALVETAKKMVKSDKQFFHKIDPQKPLKIIQLKSGESVRGKIMDGTEDFLLVHNLDIDEYKTYYFEEIESITDTNDVVKGESVIVGEPQEIIGVNKQQEEISYKPLSGSSIKKKVLQPDF